MRTKLKEKKQIVHKPQLKVERIIEVLKHVGGNICKTAHMLGCERTSVYRILKESAELQKALPEIRESAVNISELSLFTIATGRPKIVEYLRDEKGVLVKQDGKFVVVYEESELCPNLGAICFLLKTQAKDRGYVERTEVTGSKGGPIQSVELNIDAELKDLEILEGGLKMKLLKMKKVSKRKSLKKKGQIDV